MKKVVLLLFVMVCSSVEAQLQKERRVYYWDASYSMHEPNGIWESVREDLIKAISNIDDETTEIVVYPFSDSKHDHTPKIAMATDDGKTSLINWINNYTYHDNKCMTVHNLPLSDFYENRTNDHKITYMFFMTDGQNELEVKEFNEKLGQWGRRYGDKNVYGFYVMLHKSAHNKDVEHVIENQSHLWLVNTADVNIRLVRTENNGVFNIRNEKYVDIPIYGNSTDFVVKASTSDDDYKVIETMIYENSLRLFFEASKDISAITEIKDVIVSLTVNVPDEFSFWVTDKVIVKCLNKKERTLKISLQ